MQVSKWGNSLAIRIPASVSEALQLKEGDDVEVIVAGSRKFEIRRQPSREELLDQLNAYRGRIPADFIFDRDDANERGTEFS
ncbi:MAG: AbrB/MazE/SpoVT family DNA-binding domain-containing protein [Pseudohongiella sp.]|nr:AbrB/MazE/SpoVT family DNA-binding domain-containing protein [Pseudohongiella sp.]MDO9521680.1 AbrB/MazE/SpoVT family DNA-binding domain-containing protein [Pseudohongiella sp.]MDP2127575.1 AbrB/MazE/SpoVT family DNA-binding domain-containing protein [Pseudohongiella sp.]